ncbi:MAG: presenilin family intramembrane aspartyl protease PSH [Thermoproteota archaeon]
MNTAALVIILLYIAAGLLSLVLAPLYVVNELTLFENPENPMNILLLMLSIIIVFVIVMVIVRFKLEIVLKGLFYFSAFTVLFVTISIIISDSLFSIIVATSLSASILLLLHRFYKWYIVDAVGVFLSASLAAWFGASLPPHMLAILLFLMAVYDYFAVKSGGMISLAEKTLKMNLPTMLVSPIKNVPKELKVGEGEERKGAFLGLGDVAFPNMLTVSTFLNTGNTLAATLVLIGGLVGLIIVLHVVRFFKKPQPGLPYIGLGAALAWLLSQLLF